MNARERQIEAEAVRLARESREGQIGGWLFSHRRRFVEGANWADANPSPEVQALIRALEMIDECKNVNPKCPYCILKRWEALKPFKKSEGA